MQLTAKLTDAFSRDEQALLNGASLTAQSRLHRKLLHVKVNVPRETVRRKKLVKFVPSLFCVQTVTLAPTNSSSQCLSRSRSLDTVGICNANSVCTESHDAALANAAHAHFHSTHASYVSQTHSPHAVTTLGTEATVQPFAPAFAYPSLPASHPRTLSAHAQPDGLNSSSASRAAASHSQQAALEKYGVEDLMARSLRHLRLNDR